MIPLLQCTIVCDIACPTLSCFVFSPCFQESGCLKGGVMTAAAAMGMTLVDRLRAAGYTAKITHVDGKPVAEPAAASASAAKAAA